MSALKYVFEKYGKRFVTKKGIDIISFQKKRVSVKISEIISMLNEYSAIYYEHEKEKSDIREQFMQRLDARINDSWFYWVKHNGAWAIAEYLGNDHFIRFGNDMEDNISELDEIGKKIEL